MSNVIFNPAAGLSWSIKKRPRYATIVQNPTSARGQLRIAKQQYPIWEYEMNWSYLTGSEQAALGANSGLQQMMGFFMARQGAYDDFLYSDPNDNSVTGMVFGTGDGSTTSFQLQRSIGSGVDIVQNLDTSKSQPKIYKYDWQGAKNLLRSSENLTNNSVWSYSTANLTGGPVANLSTYTPIPTANAAFDPAGGMNATKLLFPLTPPALVQPQASQVVASSIGGINLASRTFTFSIWLRSDSPSPTRIALQVGDNVSESTSVYASIGAQWQRFSVTRTFSAGNANLSLVAMLNMDNTLAPATFYAWGAQLEEAASPSAYVRTADTNNWGPTLQYATPRTNLLTWSGDITNAAWVLEGTATRSAGAATAPDGVSSAQQLNCGATAGSDIYNVSSAAAANGTQWTGSVWMKSPTGTAVSVQIVVNRNGGADFEALTVTVGPKWQRYGLTHSATWSGTTNVTLGLRLNTANSSVHVWGAQLEQGTVASPYLPTTNAAVSVTDYGLGQAGLVSFATPPSNNALLAWEGSYFYRLHFTEDMNEFDEFMYQLWELQSVKFESVIV